LDTGAFNWTLDIIADEWRKFLMFRNGFAREFGSVVRRSVAEAGPLEAESDGFKEIDDFAQRWHTTNKNEPPRVEGVVGGDRGC
jgi:hypothetical protein